MAKGKQSLSKRLEKKNRNLVIVRAGDSSLHEGWLAGPENRNWDIIVSYFGKDPDRYRQPDVVRIDGPGPKWPALHELVQQLRSEVLEYDFVWFPDDDLATGKPAINRMFALCAELGLHLAQPALSLDSYWTHPITLVNSSFVVRYTNFVEIMPPVFSREFLATCIDTFAENASGYGLDSLWPTWIPDPRRIGILDACVVKHTRPVGGPNYKAVAARGKTALQELALTLKKYNLPPLQPEVTGGIDWLGRELMMPAGHGMELAELLLRGYLPALANQAPALANLMRPIWRYHLATAEAPAPRGDTVIESVIRERNDEVKRVTLQQTSARLLANGDAAKAAEVVAGAIAGHETAALWNDWASAQVQCNRPVHAELGYRRALRLDPAHKWAALNLASWFLSQSRFDEALPLLQAHADSLDDKQRAQFSNLLPGSKPPSTADMASTGVDAGADALPAALLAVLALIPNVAPAATGATGLNPPATHMQYFVQEGHALLRALPPDAQQGIIAHLSSGPAEMNDSRAPLIAARYYLTDGDFTKAAAILRTLEKRNPSAPLVAQMLQECREAAAVSGTHAEAKSQCCANWQDAVEMLRHEPLERLRDAAYLEHRFLPALGLNDEILEEFPPSLYPYCGGGLKSWQYPNQFAHYLRWLSEQAIESYLEVGCRHGGTFIVTLEYLNRFHPVHYAACVDLVVSPILREYARERAFEYRLEDSSSAAFLNFAASRKWDLALIDGDHSWEGVSTDYQNLKDHCRLVAFHDICSSVCPGVVQFWNRVTTFAPKRRVRLWTEQYPEVTTLTGNTYLGIGLYGNEEFLPVQAKKDKVPHAGIFGPTVNVVPAEVMA